MAANPINSTDPNWKHTSGLYGKITDRDFNRNDNQVKTDDAMNYSYQRSELIRQTEQWHNTGHVVQGHLFDGINEPRDITVYDYLMKFSHEIISFKI